MFYRPCICIARTLLFSLISSLPLLAAEQWVKLTTPHFELFTDAGEKKGREAILYFEQVRGFFLEASPSKHVPEFPVRIVAFRGEKQYQPYRINDFAIAYYTQSRSRDYIVMQDISAEHYPVAIHEYTHLIIKHTGLKIPIWMNEGWADLYSTLKPQGKKAVMGDILPGRAVTLLTSPWIPLEVLTSVDHGSPLYNERNKAGMFYAESWALMHMLYFSPDYRPNFAKFVMALNAGKSAGEAAQAAYQKQLWEVETDFRAYLKGNRFYRGVYDIKLEKSAEEPDISDATGFESDMLTADLLALVDKHDKARYSYEQLAKTNPDKPEIEESLGYLAWQSGEEDSARNHFARALHAGSKDPQMCYHYAILAHNGGNLDDAQTALEKAVSLKPDYVEARLHLGVLLVSKRSYQQALEQLKVIKSVTPEQAPSYFSAMAYSYLQTGDLEQGRASAENAKKWAKTPAEIQQADSMLRYLDARKTASAAGNFAPQQPGSANPFITSGDQMKRVEGIAQKLDCSGDSLLLHVLVDKTTMVFEIPDPDRVVIKHSREGKSDFACGQQKPYRVAVEYAAKVDKETGSVGIVRALEF